MDKRKKIIKKEIKAALENLKIQTKEKEKKNKVLPDFKWILTILIMSFSISLIFSFVSESVLPNVPVIVGIIVVILFILIGILFDMIGVAVTSSDEKPFHSMNSRKVPGADVAVKFKKNAAKVSSFCNDVIGDICGIVSGSAGAMIALSIADALDINKFITSLIVTALIAALTITGKAMGKSFAINKSNIILYEFSKAVSHFYKPKKHNNK